MSTQVRTADVTGALWRLPPVLRGLAVSEASHPVYLFISSLLLQKGPLAPAVAVMAPQQTPVVMAPQGLSQPPSQPVQPPQSGIATASGAPVVSQVRFCAHLHPTPPALRPQGCRHCHVCQEAGCVTAQPWTHSLIQLDVHRKSHTCPHICGRPFTQVFNSPRTHKHSHKGIELP